MGVGRSEKACILFFAKGITQTVSTRSGNVPIGDRVVFADISIEAMARGETNRQKLLMVCRTGVVQNAVIIESSHRAEYFSGLEVSFSHGQYIADWAI